jgi:transcriptional regulator with XRE-family HTH domain
MKFNEKIIKLRKLKGLTQDELASAVGVSRQAVYKWECGQSYPEVSKLLELKLLFSISIDDLLDESYEVIVPEKQKRKRRRKPEAPKPETEALDEAEAIADVAVFEDEASESAEPEGMEEKEEKEPAFAEAALSEENAEAIPLEDVAEKATEEKEPEAASEEKAAEEPEKKEVPEEPKKKRGFFSRLFGLK